VADRTADAFLAGRRDVKSALVVLDAQAGWLSDPSAPVLESLCTAVDAARTASVPVVFVRVAFRPGFPEVDERNRLFGPLARSTMTGLGVDDEATRIHPRLAPRPDEPVVIKKRVSAFSGSDLDLVLRSGRIDHLVLAGVSTSGVVLSTVRDAADRDFRLTVLADGCADPDLTLHETLLEKVFPMQARVCTVAEWMDGRGGGI
jgi:nicotinamidase-related amidase